MATYNFIQLASETFTEANANPLPAARWRVVGGDSSDAALQVVSNTCRATSTVSACGEVFIGVTVPNDHYIGIKITRNLGEVVSLYTRLSDGDNSAYEFDIVDNGDGTADIGITWLDDTDDDSELLFENPALPWANNDVFIAASIGSTHLLFQNGNIVAQAQDSRIPTGVPFLEISTDTINNVRLTNFVTGQITQQGGSSLRINGPNSFIETAGVYVWDYDFNMITIGAAHSLPLLHRGPLSSVETNGVYAWDYDYNMALIAASLGISLLTRGPLAFTFQNGSYVWDYDHNMALIQAAL